jgi:drug/metabolite transporter (DMT)-like permease
MDKSSDRVALTTFVVYSVLAGGNAVGVRFSNQELDPIWGAAFRFTLAGVLMLAVMALTRHRLPTGRALVGAALYGLLAFGGAFALAFYALVDLEAGFGQILLALVPLLTLLLAVAQGLESLSTTAVVGALLAVGGVVVMSGAVLDGDIPAISVAAAIGSAVCFAQASITIKRFPPLHPVVVNAVGMTVGAVFLLLLTFVTGNEVALPRQASTWWAVAYMVIIGSGVVFTLYVVVLRHWDASRANYGFVVIPIVTVLISAWLLDEQLTIGLISGGALVLTGVYLGALRQSTSEQPHREHP